jgi:DNA-binding MarR family transcriptional regulator
LTTNNDILLAVRKIIRATDIHSRHLAKTAGLTTPQLMLLQAIETLGAVAIARLAEAVSLSQATVTTIIDRLEERGYVQRRRSTDDRRVVHVFLTEAGAALLATAPEPLQETFSKRLAQLADWEHSLILAALQRVAGMMDADECGQTPGFDGHDLHPTTGDSVTDHGRSAATPA